MSQRYKYPSTPYLPFCEAQGSEKDRMAMSDLESLLSQPVVVTEKMDGENYTLYRGYSHARSLDSRNHWSRSWIKNFHASISHLIPEAIRICGEYLYAKHSIGFDILPALKDGDSSQEDPESV